MKGPGLFTTWEDIARMKQYMKVYPWYANAYAHIKQEVDEMISKGFAVPEEKGFVFYTHCKRDGARLLFDPYQEDNICPVCGMRYTDENFKKARICYYHHWLSQMSILAGIVYLISGEERYAQTVRKILQDYVKYYPAYPNNDNELGPTKVFQSTYMESVWLTYLVGAYDMVKDAAVFTVEDKRRIVHDLFQASAGVIFDYDEGDNNRQAFNNCGLCAAALISGDKELLSYVLEGKHGFYYHMANGVLEDGMWYEGDNYHFATVPSIVNIAEMCLGYGIDLYNREYHGHTIKDLFQAPLVSLQPDLTFPSRKDSPYMTYLGQRWYAGLYEVACRRYGKESFGTILEKIYAYQPCADISLHNAAGIMDIFPAKPADRNRMDWRGFLNANPESGEETDAFWENSVSMRGTGLSILRQKSDKSYCSLDYGAYGGEHGHPDRLQMSFFANGRRWLTDYGTGQYYFDHLQWYRSTLSHNTIVVDGKNHEKAEGREVIFGENEDFSIIEAVVENIREGVTMSRTLIKFQDGPLFDYIEMKSRDRHSYDYVLHSVGTLEIMQTKLPGQPLCGKGVYRFLEEVETYELTEDVHAAFQTEEACLDIWMPLSEKVYAYTAQSYGSPDQLTGRFPVLGIRKEAESCQFAVLLEDRACARERAAHDFRKTGKGLYALGIQNKIYELKRTEDGWQATIQDGEQTRQSFYPKKSGLEKIQERKPGDALPVYDKEICAKLKVWKNFEALYHAPWEPNIVLAQEAQIIRAETHWKGVDDLSALARISVVGQELVLEIKVRDDTPCFTGGKFLCDNDSIQLYFRRAEADYQFLVLPRTEEGCARIVETVEGSCLVETIGVSGEITEEGYELLLHIPFASIGGMPQSGEKIGFDLIINDRDTGVRRDKQMIWSGTRKGERTYLKDQRHPDGHYGSLLYQTVL